ncbi:MAG: NAD(P)H-binding protein [Chloroflexi bacterium]|nr:NAD(P)H-binding protein [Chloroflexota bacterium]
MILVTGGTGYIGRRVVHRLLEKGEKVRVLARGVRAAQLPDEVEVTTGDVAGGEGLAQAMYGVDRVVHLVAIIREAGDQTFDRVIQQGTENTVSAAKAAGVKKFVYQSALGARDDPRFSYLYAKWRAEQAVINNGPSYTVLRPSVVFGEGDEFITTLAGLVRNPVVPIAGNGRAMFQPIWIEDMVTCLLACLESAHDGEVLEIGGPEHLSYDQMIEVVQDVLGVHRLRVHVPLFAMRPVVQLMEWVLPRPMVTSEQLKMLRIDNVTAIDSVESQFGFRPKRLADGIDYIKR